MKLNFFIVLLSIAVNYGQILKTNRNDDKHRRQEVIRNSLLKPSPAFGPPIESIFPMFPKFPSILEDENPFPSSFLNQKPFFDRMHEILDKKFKKFRQIGDISPAVIPFLSSVQVMAKTDDNPFPPLKTTSELNDEMTKVRHETGLTEFHPKFSSFPGQRNLRPIITSIVKGMKPLITDLQIERKEENISSTDDNSPNLGKLSISLGWNIQEHNFDDNITVVITNYSKDGVLTEPSISPLKEMINGVLDSFSKFGKLLKHTFSGDKNSTEVQTSDNIVKAVMIQCDCPEDKHEDNCQNNGLYIKDSVYNRDHMMAISKDSSRTSAHQVLKKLINVEKTFDNNAAEAVIAIKELKESEHKVEDKNSKCFWCDYLLVTCISGISILVCLLVVLFMKRRNSGKKIKKSNPDVKVETDIHNNQNEKIDKEKKIESLVINM